MQLTQKLNGQYTVTYKSTVTVTQNL